MCVVLSCWVCGSCYSSSQKRIQSASEEIYNFPIPVGLWVPPDAWTEWKEENLTWSQAWKLLTSTYSPKIKGRALTQTPPHAPQQHTHAFFLSLCLSLSHTHAHTHTYRGNDWEKERVFQLTLMAECLHCADAAQILKDALVKERPKPQTFQANVGIRHFLSEVTQPFPFKMSALHTNI